MQMHKRTNTTKCIWLRPYKRPIRPTTTTSTTTITTTTTTLSLQEYENTDANLLAAGMSILATSSPPRVDPLKTMESVSCLARGGHVAMTTWRQRTSINALSSALLPRRPCTVMSPLLSTDMPDTLRMGGAMNGWRVDVIRK